MILVIVAQRIENQQLDEMVNSFSDLSSAFQGILSLEPELTLNGYQAITLIPNLTIEQYKEMPTAVFGSAIKEPEQDSGQ